ncbi:hypothetical protein HMPREF0574_1661 [Mobiluncus curtisii subsp. curtisii ATCC 35241]|nr:hypothetical protein HMPREF0574_1661 [Mobiluncus curtisii subsp. curtisii ATCC 35241]
MRGPRLFLFRVLGGFGLIPASAGTTHSLRFANSAAWAHPRECGDHVTQIDIKPDKRGSSPRVRGPQKTWNAIKAFFRLIPASAGTT